MDVFPHIKQEVLGYWNYIESEITFSKGNWYENYFYWLILASLLVWSLEIIIPWRKKQPIFRKDFWLDLFYMIFNFTIFNLLFFIGFATLIELGFKSSLSFLGINSIQLIDLNALPTILQLLIFFVVTDFVQWLVHRMLHRLPFLWEFHKVHHSVEEMGFAAHFRFHWMEIMLYKPALYITIAMIGGINMQNVFVVYYFTILIGHLNHANINVSYGVLKYIFNNPKMHIWHHAHELPKNHLHGVNFGISLSLWDYIFGSAYIPKEGRDIKLGFEGINNYPKRFLKQVIHPFTRK